MERGEPGRTGKRTHEAESGKGERTRSAGTPEMENGAGAEGKGRMPGWNTRHGTPEALPHEAAGKAAAPITETALRPDTKNPAPDKGGINPQIRRVRRFRIRNGVSQTAAGHGPRMEDAPHGGGGLSAAERRFGQLHYSHFLYLKYQMVSAEQKIIRPMAKI